MYTRPPRKGREVYAPGPRPSSGRDRGEGRGGKAGAPDQEAVDRLPGQQRGRVLRRDGAAGEPPQPRPRREQLEDVDGGRRGVLRRGGAAGADRPDGLVRDDQRLGRRILRERGDLALEDRGGPSRGRV